MIDEKLLSNAIRDYFVDKINTHQHEVDVVDCSADIQRMIVKLSGNGGWTPVDEGSPSDDRYVLLSFENFSVPIVGRCEHFEDGSCAYYAGDEDESLISQELFVNAWMELPGKYRDGSE